MGHTEAARDSWAQRARWHLACGSYGGGWNDAVGWSFVIRHYWVLLFSVPTAKSANLLAPQLPHLRKEMRNTTTTASELLLMSRDSIGEELALKKCYLIFF